MKKTVYPSIISFGIAASLLTGVASGERRVTNSPTPSSTSDYFPSNQVPPTMSYTSYDLSQALKNGFRQFIRDKIISQ
ncbi:hypothetical protein HYW55_02315 [Candidatus Gottesmanbacteria bacterium]|nr:hypothetical protein [Candidatus Gottesmanbacteria bacterium]